MTDAKPLSVRLARAHKRQAESYARYRDPSEPASPDEEIRPVTLPTFRFYGDQPVTYAAGRLIVGDAVVRSRDDSGD
jgi:hypothetical protein